jgi:NitT/TauT family transport system permease protein
MMKYYLYLAISKCLVFVAYCTSLIVLWHFAVIIMNVPNYIIPNPTAVFSSMIRLPEYYLKHTVTTFFEAAGGIVLGHIFGFLIGLLMRYGKWFGKLISPLVIASQVFPKEALAPLFLVYFGFGIAPKIMISTLICFFPIAINTYHGLMSTPVTYLKLMNVIGATPFQRFLECELPFAGRYILASSRVCAVLGLVGAVVGEFVGASQGLGYVIRSASADIGTDRSFAALILLGLLGGFFYGLIIVIENSFFKRYVKSI